MVRKSLTLTFLKVKVPNLKVLHSKVKLILSHVLYIRHFTPNEGNVVTVYLCTINCHYVSVKCKILTFLTPTNKL